LTGFSAVGINSILKAAFLEKGIFFDTIIAFLIND
jgi:hypothetical protein